MAVETEPQTDHLDLNLLAAEDGLEYLTFLYLPSAGITGVYHQAQFCCGKKKSTLAFIQLQENLK